MKVNQIATMLNSVFSEIIGESGLISEDLSNIVDVGRTITKSTQWGDNFDKYVAKIIDKVGYKIVMISDTLILVIVCFFYGFAHRLFPMHIAFLVCCVNYVLDSVISLASMASNLYVQDLSDNPDETKATISTGVSINHLITIFIALFGGWIWKTLGMELLFILSAVLGLCNSAYAATIRTKKGRV